jgi:hypothetical protein
MRRSVCTECLNVVFVLCVVCLGRDILKSCKNKLRVVSRMRYCGLSSEDVVRTRWAVRLGDASLVSRISSEARSAVVWRSRCG